MKNVFREMISYIWLYYGDGVFLKFFLIASVYLFVVDKDMRRKMMYPISLIAFFLLNPIIYKYIFQKIIYWRLLWIFPGAILVGVAITKIIKSINVGIVKWAVLGLAAYGIVAFGTNVYQKEWYSKTDNFYKLPNEAVEIVDVILDIDDNSKCVMPEELFSYVRQYSGDMELLYGRNVMDKYIIKSNVAAKKVYKNY